MPPCAPPCSLRQRPPARQTSPPLCPFLARGRCPEQMVPQFLDRHTPVPVEVHRLVQPHVLVSRQVKVRRRKTARKLVECRRPAPVVVHQRHQLRRPDAPALQLAFQPPEQLLARRSGTRHAATAAHVLTPLTTATAASSTTPGTPRAHPAAAANSAGSRSADDGLGEVSRRGRDAAPAAMVVATGPETCRATAPATTPATAPASLCALCQ